MKVFKALDNPKWDYRTLHGISTETSVSEDKILHIINKFKGYIVETTDPENRRIFALKDKLSQKKSRFSSVIDFIGKR